VDEQTHPQLAPEIEKFRAQRRGKLIHIYGMLLHSPDIADAWMQLINAVRWKTHLSPRLREIIIIRVAVLNKVEYVINVHRSTFAAADGVSHEECDALLNEDVGGGFSDSERAVIALTDAMTVSIDVDRRTFDEARRYFDEQQIVELTVLIGAYNMHTRVVCALEIDPE
jgi:alkylhydroperoxidase family enzyme